MKRRKSSEQEAPLVVRYEEAAQMLGGVSVRHVERLVGKRELRRVGANKARRVIYESLLAYIERAKD